jgi:hypothetical protein
VRRLGRGFVDLTVVDGLYITKHDLRWAVENGGYHLVVKTSEETLTVIQDVRELFFGNPKEMNDALERARGMDAERGIEKVTWKWIARLFNRLTVLAYAVST